MFLLSIYRGGKPLLYAEERVSLFSILRRQTPSLCRGKMFLFSIYKESRLLFYAEERLFLFSIYRRHTPSLCGEKSVSLLDIESADSSSMKRRECFSSLYIKADYFSLQGKSCFSSLDVGGRLLLHAGEHLSLRKI